MEKANDIDIANIDTNSAEFQNALSLIKYTNQSVFLTGKAGTGKSTFLRYLVSTTHKRYVVLAPTGIAAVNAGGQTIHSFFKLPFKPMLPDDPEFAADRLRKRLKYNKEHIKLLKSIDLIIIDEVSMVRADIIDFIDRILKVYCGNYRQPFAGKQLLLVGDVFQLEPVITGDTRNVLAYYYKNGNFFFNAKAFSELSIVPIELTKVFRQNDTNFVAMLDRIRIGQPLQSDIDLLNSKVVSQTTDSNEDYVMTIATRRDIVDRINESRLAELKRPERRFVGEVNGDFPDNSLPTDKELVVKEGAQVVFVKNDMEHRWVNGSIGVIAEITDKHIVVEMENGVKNTVEPHVWENVRYEYDEQKKQVNENVIGTFVQFPIKLAWAITIHKSQGLTFDRVFIDVGNGAFSSGQTYVALSRCRTLDGIRLRSPINARDIFVNNRVVEFSRTFNNQGIINRALSFAQADECYNKAAKCFEKGDYLDSVRNLAYAVSVRNMLGCENVQRLIAGKLNRLADIKTEVYELKRKLDEDHRKFLKLAIEYVDMGEELRGDGWDMQSAIANYDKAIWLCPDYYMAWLCKGFALAETGDADAAMTCLTKAAELNKDDYRALLEAGRLSIGNGDLSMGMDMLLRALQRNPKIADIHLTLAEVYDNIGETDIAEHHKKEAKRLSRPKRRK